MQRPISLLLVRLLLVTSFSFTQAFNFTTPPAQCANITMTWGTGGVAPFEVLLVPVGHVTPEVRTIIDYQNITPSSDTDPSTFSFSFPLTFPAGSQFVAVLSDSAYGPGSGGTSDILTVASSPTNDASCLGTKQVKPEFYFYLDPAAPSQCDPWEISWPQSIASLSPTGDKAISMWAVIPGEATFAVPLPSSDVPDPTDASKECSNWIVDLKEGTEVMLVAGYETGSTNGVRNGRGKGGSTDILTVGKSLSGSNKCLIEDPPHTTTFAAAPTPNAGVPASSTTTSSVSPLGTAGRQGGAAASVPHGVSSTLAIAAAVMAVVGVGLA